MPSKALKLGMIRFVRHDQVYVVNLFLCSGAQNRLEGHAWRRILGSDHVAGWSHGGWEGLRFKSESSLFQNKFYEVQDAHIIFTLRQSWGVSDFHV